MCVMAISCYVPVVWFGLVGLVWFGLVWFGLIRLGSVSALEVVISLFWFSLGTLIYKRRHKERGEYRPWC